MMASAKERKTNKVIGRGYAPGDAEGPLTSIVIAYLLSPYEAVVLQVIFPLHRTLKVISSSTTITRAMEETAAAGWIDGLRILFESDKKGELSVNNALRRAA